MWPCYHHRTLPSSPNWFGCSLARRCLMGEEINCRITRRGEAESGWCPTIISIFHHILISIFFCLYFPPSSYCYFHHSSVPPPPPPPGCWDNWLTLFSVFCMVWSVFSQNSTSSVQFPRANWHPSQIQIHSIFHKCIWQMKEIQIWQMKEIQIHSTSSTSAIRPRKLFPFLLSLIFSLWFISICIFLFDKWSYAKEKY